MNFKRYFRNKLNNSRIGEDLWRVLHLANLRVNGLYSDEAYFKKIYRRATNKELDFNNPQTFDEKQLWLKMFYRNPLCTKCSDKYLVREYVKECGLEHILNPLFAVYDKVSDIKWDELPERFYIKANHMSACNVRCNDIRTFDRKYAEKRLSRGMKHNYYLDSREWNYKDIDRKIIVEQIIESKTGEELVDYRFLCSNGHCEYVFIDIGTAADDGKHKHDARRNVYDRDMNLLPVKVTRNNFPVELVKKPDNYDEMLEYAERLSGNFPFCRVDLYNVDGQIIFGEITFFHSGGISRIQPEEWKVKMGEFIDLSNAMKEKEAKRS